MVFAACSSAPLGSDQPFPPPPEPQLVIRFLHLPAPAWELQARTESGAVRRRDGVGDTAELRLPPGPGSLWLRSGGREFTRPYSIGSVEGPVMVWDLAAR